MRILIADDHAIVRRGLSEILLEAWPSAEIEQVGDSCHLTLTHDQMRDGANSQIYGGWPMILSGLKTWLETGELLTTPGSLLYS